VSIPWQWEGEVLPQHVEVIQTANTRYDFLPQALHRVYGVATPGALQEVLVAPLAMGGAMAVYKLTVWLTDRIPYALICKIPHQRRIVYASGMASEAVDDSTHRLLTRLVALAEHLTQQAPGLFPRSGGLWHWHKADGTPQYVLVEEFIPGVSVQRLKHRYEQALVTGQLSPEAYAQRRTAIERLAVATFTRLWHALGRQTFTADPSPWNVLIRQPAQAGSAPPVATVIDLHSLEDNVGLAYVVQRLAAVYGMRQEVLEQALLPGILDALGTEAGRALLMAELPELEAEAQRLRRNLGVDLQRPLLSAIRSRFNSFQELDLSRPH
jgi:hypothetical protein